MHTESWITSTNKMSTKMGWSRVSGQVCTNMSGSRRRASTATSFHRQVLWKDKSLPCISSRRPGKQCLPVSQLLVKHCRTMFIQTENTPNGDVSDSLT